MGYCPHDIPNADFNAFSQFHLHILLEDFKLLPIQSEHSHVSNPMCIQVLLESVTVLMQEWGQKL